MNTQILSPDGTPLDPSTIAAPVAPAPEPDTGVLTVGGHAYMRDGKGRLVPLAAVRPEDQLEDQMVRKIVGFAEDLSARIARFRGHTFDDVAALLDLLAEKYGAKRGGPKGNVTFTSYDGTLRVTVQVQDQISFGPELQIAKRLVDACITEWAGQVGDGAVELRTLIEHAFQVDKEGRINRAALFALRRLQITHPQWIAAMQALSDAIRVIGSKEYVRFYKRASPTGAWEPITIDLAAV